MTEEVKLPKTETELRALLELAIEGGRHMDPRETEAEPRASKQQLQEEFKTDLASLLADRRKSPSKLRALQAKYVAAGLTTEEVDTTPPQPNWRGRSIHDWVPPSYR